MPRLWEQTIAGHRHAVRDAALDAVSAIVTERGLSGVSMSAVAERTGIARATLYKYFVDADAAVVAWHEREIGRHLADLRELAAASDDPMARLDGVLSAYGAICQRRHHDGASAGALHAGSAVVNAETQLLVFLESLLRDATDVGSVRADVPAKELARFCVHALSAAGGLSGKGVTRVVAVTLDGLRPPT